MAKTDTKINERCLNNAIEVFKNILSTNKTIIINSNITL